MTIADADGNTYDNEGHFWAAQWDPKTYAGNQDTSSKQAPEASTKPTDALNPSSGSKVAGSNNTSPEPSQGVMDKLLGNNGPRYQLWPERAVRGLYGSIHDVLSGNVDLNSEEGINKVNDLAGVLIGGPSPFRLADGTLGSFAGVTAKTADHGALKTAQDAIEQGIPREEVFKKTGWFQGTDNAWRYEIPTKDAKFNGSAIPNREEGSVKLGEILDHPELYEAYPHMKDIPVAIDNSIANGAGAKYTGNGILMGDRLAAGKTLNDPKGVILHELQHDIQRKEGFATGGMAGIPGVHFPIPIGQTKEEAALQAYENYRRIAGEAEAHNVQTRMNIPDNQRGDIPPWKTEYPPADRQVVNYEPIRANADHFENSRGQTMPAYEEPETVKSAAIQYKGETFEGMMHAFALDDIEKKYGIGIPGKDLNEGFTTNKGRFISREEAYQLANKNEQIRQPIVDATKDQKDPMLLSEDLKDVYDKIVGESDTAKHIFGQDYTPPPNVTNMRRAANDNEKVARLPFEKVNPGSPPKGMTRDQANLNSFLASKNVERSAESLKMAIDRDEATSLFRKEIDLHDQRLSMIEKNKNGGWNDISQAKFDKLGKQIKEIQDQLYGPE